MADKNEINMTYGSMWSKVIMFTIPLIMSAVLQLLFNSADMVVVGKFAGDEALASVGATGSITTLFTNLFLGLSTGATITASRYYGSNKAEAMSKAAHTSISIAIIGGLLLAILGNIFALPVLKLTGVPENIIHKSETYLRIIFLGMPFNMLYNYSAGIMRAYGDTKKPFVFLSIAGVVNVLLNLLFVIVFKMDVAGVATATVISHAISSILVIRTLRKVDNAFKISLRKLKIHMVQFKEILFAGIPSGIQGSMFSISNVIIQSALNSFGAVAVAGGGASGSVEGYVYVVMNSISVTMITVASQNYGALKYKRIVKGWVTCGTLIIASGLVLGVFSSIFAKPLLNIFINSPDAIDFGARKLVIITSTYFLCGIMELSVNALRGIGKFIQPTIISVFGICVFRVLWVYTVFEKFKNVDCLYLSYPVSWIITGGILTIMFFSLINKKIKGAQENETNDSIA